MPFLNQFHPSNFFRALREIDDEAATERAKLKKPDYRAAIILFISTFCILFTAYLSGPRMFRRFLKIVHQLTGYGPDELFFIPAIAVFSPVLINVWWAFVIFIGFVLIPVLAIKYVIRDSVRNYGNSVSGIVPHLKWYLILTAILLVGSTALSFNNDFIRYYPFYRLAHRSWADLLIWECIYFMQFVSIEFFFRGFLLHGCKHAFGSNALFVMCVPYVMIHITKPWMEAVFSMFFGLIIGVLVLRSRSIWGAVLVHWVMALNMDLMALLHTRGLPVKWWP